MRACACLNIKEGFLSCTGTHLRGITRNNVFITVSGAKVRLLMFFDQQIFQILFHMISPVQQLVSPCSLKQPEHGLPKLHPFFSFHYLFTLGTALSLQCPIYMHIPLQNLCPSLPAQVGTHHPHPSITATFPSTGRAISVPSSKQVGVAY